MVSEEKFMKRQGKNAMIKRCDMSRLEDEYDYDTESEQIIQSKTMLATDLHDAVEWFVIGDPLEVVGNFSIWNSIETHTTLNDYSNKLSLTFYFDILTQIAQNGLEKPCYSLFLN